MFEPPLDALESRILGCLVEKQLSTPDYYPLTLNALLSACNQSSNRDPVLVLDEEAATTGLEGLRRRGLLYEVTGAGSRTLKYEHRLEETLLYVRLHRQPPPGHVGGRRFGNFGRGGEQRLPVRTGRGSRIDYQEWDIHPRRPGRNRGAERLVTGSDGRAWYSADHYCSFTEMRR